MLEGAQRALCGAGLVCRRRPRRALSASLRPASGAQALSRLSALSLACCCRLHRLLNHDLHPAGSLADGPDSLADNPWQVEVAVPQAPAGELHKMPGHAFVTARVHPGAMCLATLMCLEWPCTCTQVPFQGC